HGAARHRHRGRRTLRGLIGERRDPFGRQRRGLGRHADEGDVVVVALRSSEPRWHPKVSVDPYCTIDATGGAMNTAELCTKSLTEIAALLQRRDVSPVELTRATLERIDELNGTLHAYLNVIPERALAAARAAESE